MKPGRVVKKRPPPPGVWAIGGWRREPLCEVGTRRAGSPARPCEFSVFVPTLLFNFYLFSLFFYLIVQS